MRAARTIVVCASVAFAASAVACQGAGDDGAGVSTGVTGEGGASYAPSDASAAVIGDAAADSPASQDGTVEAMTSGPAEAGALASAVAGIRIANWSPDAPAIDLCLAPHGTTAFRGPLLGRFSGAAEDGGEDAATPGLSFPYSSAYTYVSPGQYDARLVVAGAPDCRAGIGADATSLPVLMPDGYATIALMGEANPVGGAPGLGLVAFRDDGYAPTGAALRFINAAPTVAFADFWEVSATKLSPLYLAVPFGHAGATAADTNGYTQFAGFSDATFSLHAQNQGESLATAANVNVAAGAIVTIVAVGASSAALVECVDNAGTLSYVGTCAVISAGGNGSSL